MSELKKQQKGITLVALTITFIVLAILATISINMISGDDSIANKTIEAKEQSEIIEEKKVLSLSVNKAKEKNKYGELKQSELESKLNVESNGKAKIIDSDDFAITVQFTNSGRYYEIDKNGNVEYIEGASGVKKLTVQCVNSAGTVLAEKQYTILKDTYSKKAPTVNDYVIAQDEILTGEITENKTIQVLYYLILNDDTELVFTGLNSAGNVTADESQIVAYMIGDGSNTRPNAFKDSNLKNIKSMIKIPESYNEKNVIKIGKNAFSAGKQIMKINLTDNITTISDHAFYDCDGLQELTINKNITSIGHEAIMSCGKLEKITFNNKIKSYAQVFHQSNQWTKIEENSDEYVVEDNILYSSDKKTLILCPTGRTGDFVIPDFVETVENCAFDSARIQSIDYGNNLKNIGERSFQSLIITKIELGKNIETIKPLAFYQCKQLEEVTIRENITSIGQQAFLSCDKLKTVIIDSLNIARGITSKESNHYLVNVAETIYIRNDITEVGSYITGNFSIVETDKEGYVKYVKNAS